MPKIEERKSLKIQKASPDASWDAFAKKQSGLLYFSSTWAQTLEEGYKKYKAKASVFVFQEDNEILCGTVGVTLNFGFIKIFFDQVPYGGLLGQKDLFPEFLAQLEVALKKEGIHQIRITSHCLNRFELTEGYEAKKTCQHVLNLENFTKEKLWDSYGSTTRWAIKKAIREKVTIHKVTSVEEIDAYYVLYRKTMKRNQTVGPFPKEYFTSIYKGLVQRGLADFIYAKREGLTIAAKLLMYSEDGVIDYLSVSDEDYFSFRPNELLTHDAIEKAIENHNKYFDFATGYGFGDSLSKFKEKWGAKPYEFQTYIKDFHPWRCRLWDSLWRFANTKFGTSLLGVLRKFHG